MMLGAQAQARWEIDMARTILADRKRLLILGLLVLPILAGSVALAAPISDVMPEFLGGEKAYSPTFFSTGIFGVSIFIGLCAGLITGCIGAGGGFVIAPALMSAGIRGILAVGTDLFHIFAKAIMGTVIHRRLGNVNVALAVTFLVGAIFGATVGGMINRVIYEVSPVLSDAFITTIYVIILGGLGFYALSDFLRARKKDSVAAPHSGKTEGVEMGGLPRRLQAVKIPPMIAFDQGLVPGGRRISAVFLVLSGALVGFCAAIMGVGGGFLTFPIFVYMLGVSSITTVGTDIFQIDLAVRDLRLHLLHAGHGHASRVAAGDPDRRHGHHGRRGDHDPRILRHGGTGRLRQPCLRAPGQAGGAGGSSALPFHRERAEPDRYLGLLPRDRDLRRVGDRHLLLQSQDAEGRATVP